MSAEKPRPWTLSGQQLSTHWFVPITGPAIGRRELVEVIEKSAYDAAERQLQDATEALREARALIDSEVDNATEAALNADRAAAVIDAALSRIEQPACCGYHTYGSARIAEWNALSQEQRSALVNARCEARIEQPPAESVEAGEKKRNTTTVPSAEQVERVARAIFDVDDPEVVSIPPGREQEYLRLARAAIAAYTERDKA